MKRIIVGIFSVFLMFEAVVVLAAKQPHNLGYVALSISSGTVTEISRSTAPTVGFLRYCTNCAGGGAMGTICVSTSTASPGAGSDFVLSTGTICK